jgi:alkylhydroperoxidase family enzyme
MSRIEPAPAAVYEPVFGADAALRLQVYSQAPELAAAFIEFGQRMRAASKLPPRLIELVRLRVAFHNQCRTCMAVRYEYGIEDGLTEDLVCSLEKPEEAEDLTAAERAALAFADKLATNHHLIEDADFQRLREHFSEPEMMELCFHTASYVGFGRMAMVLDMVEDLPEGLRAEGPTQPWNQPELVRL